MKNTPTPDPRARVRLFGGPELEVDGVSVKISPSERCLLALVFADSPQGISRVRAAEILWDEPVGPKHRHRLSSYGHKINSKAGAQVVGGDEEWLRRGADAQPRADGADFGDEASSGGRFLSRCTRSPSASFDEWRTQKEKRITRLLKEHFEAELERARDAGEWERADGVIQILARAEEDGDDGEGSGSVYRELAERSAAILRERPPSPLGKRNAPATLEEVSELFIGRTEEARRLVAGVVTHSEGFSLSVVTGVEGIGKSTLLKEMARRVGETDTTVVRCFCSEPTSNITLGPLVEFLSGGEATEHIERMESPWREVVRSLLPLKAGEEARAPLPYIDPKQIPVRLYEALRRLMESLCSVRPLLVVIDNYEWHDATTHAALSYIGAHWRTGRMHLAIGARARDKDIDLMIPMLEGEDVTVDHLHLEELSPEHSVDLALSVIPEIDTRTLEQVCEAAAGHPLFLVELAREVSDGTDLHPGTLLPPSISEIVIGRLGRLEESDRGLLSLIAVMGRPTTLAELSAIGRRELLSTAEAAGRLAELHLVSQSHGTVEVRHDLTRRALYSELSAASRALLHRSIAEGLEAESTEVPAELAHHYAEAGVTERALEYAILAADVAELAGGVGEAVRFLKLARNLTEDEAQDTRLLGRLADLEYLHGDPSETIPLLELAAGRLKAAGDMAGSIRARVHKVDLLREVDGWSLHDLYKALEFEKEEARTHAEWEELANALHIQMRMAQVAADREKAQALFREAQACLNISGLTTRGACRAHCALTHQILLGDPNDGLNCARRAVELAEQEGNVPHLLLRANLLRMSALIVRGLLDSDEGREVLARAHLLAQKGGDLGRKVDLLSNEGAWCIDVGRLEEARDCLERAVSEVGGPTRKDSLALVYLNFGELELICENYDDADQHFRFVESVVSGSEDEMRKRWTLVSNAGVGLCALRTGRIAEAKKRLLASPPMPDDWLTDPTIPATFRAAMLSHEGKIREGADLLADVARNVSHRFPVQELRVRLEEIRLLRRVDPVRAQLRAIEGAEMATSLEIHSHAATFDLYARILG
jgi:tetratricopeptide (TPR) repeat protein